MPIITLAAIAGILALLALVPTRRLFLRGWSTASLTTYYLATWGLAVLLALAPGRARFVLPLLAIAVVLPYLPLPVWLDRLLGGGGGRAAERPPMKNVTPPDLPPPGEGA